MIISIIFSIVITLMLVVTTELESGGDTSLIPGILGAGVIAIVIILVIGLFL